MRPPDDRVYDFERDAWVSVGAIRPAPRELPEPATPPAPGRWTAPPLRNGNPVDRIPRGLLWIAAGLAAPFLAVASQSPFLLLGVLLIPVGTVTLARQTLPPPSKDDLRLLETGDDPDVCLVEVVVARQGRACGTDRGVAWFEGGRLLFNGHRTSFAVGGEDILPRSGWRSPYDEHLALPLRGTGTPCLDFFVLDGREDAAHDFESRFREFRARPPRSRGPRQWPPFP